MNVAFLIISAISVVLMIARAPEAAFPTMIDGVTHAIELSIKLCAIYAVWLSVLKMVEATSLDKKLSKLLRPIVRKIFKNESDEAYDYISINLAANMFGMGGVATPAGIKAMSAMSDGSDRASDNMIMLLVINATSIQLIPATVIAMRAGANSQSPSDIILPTLISSGIATLVGAIMCKVLSLKKSDFNKTNKTSTLFTTKEKIKPPFAVIVKNFVEVRNERKHVRIAGFAHCAYHRLHCQKGESVRLLFARREGRIEPCYRCVSVYRVHIRVYRTV